MKKILNLIGGEMRPAAAGRTLDVFEPATGQVYAQLPDSDDTEVNAAIQAAETAYPEWSRLSAATRSRYLRKLSALLREQLEEFAQAESIDTGKPITVARTVDIPRAALNFEFFADAATQFSSESHATDSQTLNYTLRTPLGVVACISPWNLPLYLLSWKIAPALAAGNTVVAKPSEITPMTAFLLGEISVKAGLPPGVLNLVHGTGPKVGAPLVRAQTIKAISFTGSTQTGAEITRQTAGHFKKLSLEMGGKNPTLIFNDFDSEADFNEAVSETVRAAFSNQGQICLCGSRILIHRPIYDRFKRALIEKTQALKPADPLNAATQQGAVVSQAHFDKILSHLEIARKEGGRVLIGGEREQVGGRCRDGWFIQPTLIEGLDSNCRTNQDEIFGPVATLIPFDTEEQAIEIANSTRYGLAASIFTSNSKRAHRVAAQLQSGLVWINCWMQRDLRVPFGGVKDSGVGREGGHEAMRFFTEAKNVCIRY